MKINAAGLALIKEFEGCKLKAYKDIVGVWTVGYGRTGVGVTEGLKITQEKAEELLLLDIAHFASGVSRLIKAPLTDNQFAALVSFSFNLGLSALTRSTLRKVLNQKKYVQTAEEFLKWDMAGGAHVPGLTRRRKAERALFLLA